MHNEPCGSVWAALNRAEYHIEAVAADVEPVSISTPLATFNRAHIFMLLDVWSDPARIKRDA